MEILYALIPLSIVLISVAIYIFTWAVKSGQFDDLEGPAHSILFDDADTSTHAQKKQSSPAATDKDDAPGSRADD
ncbi:MAG: cbb3-type cytochrome oxidase assembly protein CcoS [Gammaproteobacteria bacterium]|nr:cbb3-type cytochrome oxidase assembly protein CcoS [Gammaproteobacteria bacterium]